MENNQIKLGALLSYLSILINIVAGLVYTPWMIQTIGESDYGLFTLANSLITLFLMDFGLSSAATRYLSKYKAEGNQEKINNFMGLIYKLYLIIDVIIFLVIRHVRPLWVSNTLLIFLLVTDVRNRATSSCWHLVILIR